MQEPPLPPWIRYHGESPYWGGWRQGESETWLRDTWLPFWRALSADEREGYLLRWPPPDEDWHVYATVHWV
jgi:hypothetical protein